MHRRQFLTAMVTGPVFSLSSDGGAPHLVSSGPDLADSNAVGPSVYWPWMNGQISRDGISRDLAAMQKMGIRGAYILNNGIGIPRGPIDYNTPAWHEMVVHACNEAARQGVTLYMHQSAGYSGTGGAWVRPEQSQQQLVWSENACVGGQVVSIGLHAPLRKLGWYRDVAVLAFPTPIGEGSLFHDLVTEVRTVDGRVSPSLLRGPVADTTLRLVPQGGTSATLDISLSVAMTAHGLRLYRRPELPPDPFDGPRDASPNIELMVSDDGVTYRAVTRFRPPALRALDAPAVMSFPAQTARYWRLVAEGPCWISGFSLETGARLQDWAIKANGAPGDVRPVARNDVAPGINPADVVDLSNMIDGAGHLRWDAPPGRWTILRFGQTATGEVLAAAADSGEGLNIDMFDTAAVDAHFAAEIDPLLAALGAHRGKTFKALHIDSFEAGRQNWTKAFPEEFARRRGYALGPWLLTMTGRIVGDVGRSEKALYDIRRTHAELMADAYYGRMRENCHARGLDLHGEPYGDGAFDCLGVARQLDVALGEFWTRYTYGRDAYTRLAVADAHSKGNTIVPCEAFTGEPKTSSWTESPFALKALGDRMCALGVTDFVLHTFVHQPNDYARPGMTMGPFGVHFDRHSIWADAMSDWVAYFRRTHHILRQGMSVVDVACFKSEEPVRNLVDTREPPFDIPSCYGVDTIDATTLAVMTAENRCLVGRSGMSYRVLVLPPLAAATVAVMTKLVALAKAGVPIVATTLPRRCLGGPNDIGADAAVAALSDRLGKLVMRSTDTASALAACGLVPDLTYACDGFVNFQHRRVGDCDVYFVALDSRTPQRVTLSLREIRGRVRIWRAESQDFEIVQGEPTADGRLRITLDFGPAEAVFVLLDDEKLERSDWTAIQMVTNRSSHHADAVDEFTISLWLTPETALLSDRPRGLVIYPETGRKIFGDGHALCGLAAGRQAVVLYERAEQLVPVLRFNCGISGWTHLAIVYAGRKPTLYINGKPVLEGGPSAWHVHPGTEHPAGAEQIRSRFEGDVAGLVIEGRALRQDEIASRFADGLPDPPTLNGIVLRRAGGRTAVTVAQDGNYLLRDTHGVVHPLPIKGLRQLKLASPWRLKFPPGSGAPQQTTLAELQSLSQHADFGVRHFSGQVVYHRDITLNRLAKHRVLLMDLGRVECIASVSLNGVPCGRAWHPPFLFDLTAAARPGRNHLAITVTTLWPNRLIGDAQLPPEAEYARTGQILAFPAWFSEGQPKPGAQITFAAWRHVQPDDPLLAAGLLGPVYLHEALHRQL